MKIAAFNVENLFDRPKAFNLEDHARGAAITDAVAELNVLINKDEYSAADKARMLALIAELKLTSSNPPFVNFRKIRGAFWKKPPASMPQPIRPSFPASPSSSRRC